MSMPQFIFIVCIGALIRFFVRQYINLFSIKYKFNLTVYSLFSSPLYNKGLLKSNPSIPVIGSIALTQIKNLDRDLSTLNDKELNELNKDIKDKRLEICREIININNNEQVSLSKDMEEKLEIGEKEKDLDKFTQIMKEIGDINEKIGSNERKIEELGAVVDKLGDKANEIRAVVDKLGDKANEIGATHRVNHDNVSDSNSNTDAD
jgi:vacuolar-type H+-ATPase subunit I/STV1